MEGHISSLTFLQLTIVTASSSKTTALEVYTPTSGTLTQGDEFPLTSISEGPPPEYQVNFHNLIFFMQNMHDL